MADITTDQIKKLRDKTGVSVMQCKKALEEAKGDMNKAEVILQKQSAQAAKKKSDRTLGAGVIGSYLHSNNSVGALVELQCETDFVAKNEEFQTVAYELAMQVAAMNPEFLSEDDITEDDKKAANSVFEEEVKDKPEDLQEKILKGKLDAYFKDKVLLNQDYIKDKDKTVKDLVQEATQKFGENVEIASFARLGVLEE